MMTELYDHPHTTDHGGALRYYRFDNNFGARVDVLGGQYVVTPVRWKDDAHEPTTLTRVTRATLGHPAHVELSLRALKDTPGTA